MAESYRRWRLPELWEMVAADDAEDAHLHLATLRRQQTALETQRDRLRVLRDQLAEAWPPEKSEAATAFADKLNDMIDAMTGTARGAGEVRGSLVHIVNVIQESRSKLASLVAEYGKASELADPRVGQHAKKLLDQRARDVLIAADATVVKAMGLLNVPMPQYTRFSTQGVVPIPVTAVGTGSPGSSAGTGSGHRLALSSSGAATALVPPRFEPPAPAIDEDFLLTGRHVTDVLGAGGMNPGPPPAGSSVSVRSTGGEAVTYPVIGSPGGFGARGATAGGGPVGQPTTMRPFGTPLVGGSAPAGSNRIGGATSAAMRRPAAATSPYSARPVGGGGGGGYQDRSFDEYIARRRTQQRDGEGTWSVPEGVRPLFEAEMPTAHDPGPGVLGIDR
ncbi:WXG100 family type VII secretion target [Dactylosporangium sp. NBC_01737]|uniref:WXG100 family type VII secretion target n=1 Tax=Dactylosporangium sp. NBC_01737 TaxID=2975959 RepID=UPI002E0E4902|nr:WXG100 family type VII secretion target [Dactylosporangium sp. NBC_01737]